MGGLHSLPLPDIDLCPQAFAEGRFPPGTCSKDFIKIDSKVSKSKHSGWSDQEQLLLLEAIELFGENFDKVAEHVGTKNKLDCVMQFLQMPIDEECVKNLRHSQVPRVCRLQP
jgi:SWI/SNF related-matrix-associated actin-dependent regulator of chromatin subfamily C